MSKRMILIIIVLIFLLTIFFGYSYYCKYIKKDLIYTDKSIPLLWEKTFDEDIADILISDISANQAYIACEKNRGLTLIDTNNGSLINSISFPISYNKINTKLTNGKLYSVLDNKNLVILDLATKDISTILNKKFYNNFIIDENNIITYNRKSDFLIYNIINKDYVYKKTNNSNLKYLAIDNDKILYSTQGYNINVLSLRDFSKLWSYGKKGDHISAEITFDKNNLYFCNDNNMITFDINTGEQINTYPFATSQMFSYSNYLITNNFRSITKINKEDGNIINQLNIPTGGINLNKDFIYFVDIKNVNFCKMDINTFNIEWKTKWTSGYDCVSKLSISNGDCLIIERNDGIVMVIDNNNGNILWAFNEYRDKYNIKVKLIDNILIITDGKNKVYAYDLGEIKN